MGRGRGPHGHSTRYCGSDGAARAHTCTCNSVSGGRETGKKSPDGGHWANKGEGDCALLVECINAVIRTAR